jgi:uncharacterized damage-inducible protein DinB
VLNGKMLVDEREEDYASMDALRGFRDRVVDVTSEYLMNASDDELNERRPMRVWGPKGDREVDYLPAHVVLRTQTHAYHHMGQITAMARLLGRSVPVGLDFPLAEGPAQG